MQVHVADTFVSDTDYWADAWRQDIKVELRGINTTNYVERFFKRLKHEFLKSVVNRRLSDLLKLLIVDIDSFFISRRRLLMAGRVASKEENNAVRRRRQISGLWENLMSIVIHDADIGLASVKSTRNHGVYRQCAGNSVMLCCAHERAHCFWDCYYHSVVNSQVSSIASAHTVKNTAIIASTWRQRTHTLI